MIQCYLYKSSSQSKTLRFLISIHEFEFCVYLKENSDYYDNFFAKKTSKKMDKSDVYENVSKIPSKKIKELLKLIIKYMCKYKLAFISCDNTFLLINSYNGSQIIPIEKSLHDTIYWIMNPAKCLLKKIKAYESG